jgi:hypothetical protein
MAEFLIWDLDLRGKERTGAWQLLFVVCCGGVLPGIVSAQSSDSIFRNTDPSVAYVGSATCLVSGCHEDIGRAYAHSSHGESMAPANRPAELARVPHPFTVVNPKNHRTYTVYQKGGELYQSVAEQDKAGRTLYTAAHKIDYVVGGERTGYTYLFRVDGWILQAPLSFYAPSKTWELSPGYAADDPGFSRVMTTGCLVCHNGQPDPIARRDGLYKNPPFRFAELGIGCEACHGPGALHVEAMKSHKDRVLQAREVDTSIVNPAKLSPRLADDICRECHQAGDAVVLMPGKSYLDFRPGQPLTETMAIVKRPIRADQRAEANRLETNPPVRGSLEQPLWWKNSTLELSKCYTASHGRLTCSTCHSTHHAAAPGEEKAAYRAACLTCHAAASCTLKSDAPERAAVGDYCIACHMEKRPIAGIAHSNDTKHRIVRFPGQPLPEIAFEQPKPDLPGLLWMNRPAENSSLPGTAQLQAYWTVARKDPSLSAQWLGKLRELSSTDPDAPDVLNANGVLALAGKDFARAAAEFERALQAGSADPTTFLNLSTALAGDGRGAESAAVLERGVKAYPLSGALVTRYTQQCLALNDPFRPRDALERYSKLFPEDAEAGALLQTVRSQIEAHGSAPATTALPANHR